MYRHSIRNEGGRQEVQATGNLVQGTVVPPLMAKNIVR